MRKWLFRNAVCLALNFGAMHTVWAQNDTLILEEREAVAMALANNYDIALVKNDSLVYALEDEFSDAVFLPRINATGGLVNNVNNQRQLLADNSKRERSGLRSNQLQSAVNLNWTIFDGFKMFTTRRRMLEMAKLGPLAMQEQVQTTVAAVLNTYYNIVRQKQRLAAIQEQMGLNEERMILAEKKLQVGLGAKPELLQANVDLNAQRTAKIQQLSLIAQLKDELNLLMGIKDGFVFNVSDSIPIDKNIVLGNVLDSVANKSPLLQTALQNISVAELTLKERRAERFPVITFNSAYNFSRNENQSVLNAFTTLQNRNAGFNYGVGISLPILNGASVRRNIRQAALDLDYQKLNYNKQAATLTTGAQRAYKDYEMQLQILAVEEDNIRLARENLFISRERLRLGITTLLEMREAQKSLADAFERLITARYNAKLAETELLRLQGSLIND